MRATMLARAGSAAAAAIAATGAIATAGAASAATRHVRPLPTQLSIAQLRAVAHHKPVALIAGRLTSFRFPLPGKEVFLDRGTPQTGWVVVGRERTGRFGDVAFVVSPKVTARYALVFAGTPQFRASHSRVVLDKRG